MEITTLDQIIDGRTVVAIEPTETVQSASEIMGNENIGALIVTKGDTLVGILSERDIVRRCVVYKRNPEKTTVGEIMTANPRSVSTKATASEALSIMLVGGFRHVPIVDNGIAVSMISMRDFPAENHLALKN
ncbi:MAG: CBS domain-containing protein [Roseobacter sp.]